MRSTLLSAARTWAVTGVLVLAAGPAAAAEKKYDPGASDTEIKVGQTVPHSGPGSLAWLPGTLLGGIQVGQRAGKRERGAAVGPAIDRQACRA